MTPIVVSGPKLAVETCARRLGHLGARPEAGSGDGTDDELALHWEGPGSGTPLEVDLSWYGPAKVGARAGSEAAVQAMTGLMRVHGRDTGAPRRIGLEVASVAAGLLAAHAVLAARVGRTRGLQVTGVETSVLQAGLLLVSHRVAADSSGQEWVPVPDGPAPGPPFRSAEGAWFEIETLDPEAWKIFWERLGAGGADLGWAWRLFRPRYFRGTCTLPPGLHEATAALPMATIAATAEACKVSLCRVRDYDDVVGELHASDSHPRSEPHSKPAIPRPGGEMLPQDGALPLSGVRVLEATSRMQGPLASMLLQMLGAHVVRVEPPGGDLFRTVPPMLGDTGSFFRTFNRGKDAVELDLRSQSGRDELVELVAGADVFLQNWRPGKAAEWGLESHDLAAANPRLVYAYASGWGHRAGLEHLLGTDFLVQAHTGIAAGINPEGEPAVPSRALLTDYAGALITCEAILTGLYDTQRTGRGHRVEASLLGGAMALQAHVLDAITTSEVDGRRRGRPVWGPLDRPLRTADGAMIISVADDDALRRLCDCCELPAGTTARASVEAAIAEQIAHHPTAWWEEQLTEAGIPCAGVCRDLSTLPEDPRIVELFEPLPAGAAVPRSPWRLLP